MAGLNSPRTLKVKGSIQGCKVVVLIDGGATHNLIDENLVGSLQLPIAVTKGYGVVLKASGSIQATGICKGMITHDFLIIIMHNL